MILVTGGAGFIGSNFIKYCLDSESEPVACVDSLTYAGNISNINECFKSPRFFFNKTDIVNHDDLSKVVRFYKPNSVIHFAAESHVDRSIEYPRAFIDTNIIGTFNLLEVCLKYFSGLQGSEKEKFKLINISTDEVFGSLTAEESPFKETTAYAPNSPYSASKAAADHLVRAYHHTYGLPVITTNCSNNYGPMQFPEKLIPLMITKALSDKPLPIYGDGLNVRDWLYVEDHCEALALVLKNGQVGQSYNIGGNSELNNVSIVDSICKTLDLHKPRKDGKSYLLQKSFVKDRLGHDRRYAIDYTKLERELGWKPKQSFESGLVRTVKWYLEHSTWIENVMSGEYQKNNISYVVKRES